MHSDVDWTQRVRALDVSVIAELTFVWVFFPKALLTGEFIILMEGLVAVFVGTFIRLPWRDKVPAVTPARIEAESPVELPAKRSLRLPISPSVQPFMNMVRDARDTFSMSEGGETCEVLFGPVEVVPNKALLDLVEQDRRQNLRAVTYSMEPVNRLQAVLDGRL
jgi:hypothetical protein